MTSYRGRTNATDLALTASISGDAPPDAAGMFLAHYLDLVRLARLLIDDRETAEDIVQDVFAAMQTRWRKLPDEAAALRYLRTAVVNRSRSALRRRINRRKNEAGHTDHVVVPPAEAAALARFEHARIQRAVAALPSRQREVIVLRYFQNLSVAEAAEVLKISPGAVKSSASRALDTIEKAMTRQP